MGCGFSKHDANEKCHQHQDHIDNFSYAHGCTDWADAFHLKIGNRQSPIDIPVDKALDESEAPVQMKLKFNSNPLPITTEYTATTFRTQPSTEPIAEIILTDSKDNSKSQLYQSVGLHFHAKSEHKLSGFQYDSEVHIVFKKAGPSVLENNFCVIGILFVCDQYSSQVEKRKALTAFHPESPGIPLTINIRDIFEALFNNLKFLHYKGSLTTPPCTESVNWFVHPDVFPIIPEDINTFKNHWTDNKEFCSTGTGNSRPVCDLHDRKIYKISAEELLKFSGN